MSKVPAFAIVLAELLLRFLPPSVVVYAITRLFNLQFFTIGFTRPVNELLDQMVKLSVRDSGASIASDVVRFGFARGAGLLLPVVLFDSSKPLLPSAFALRLIGIVLIGVFRSKLLLLNSLVINAKSLAPLLLASLRTAMIVGGARKA